MEILELKKEDYVGKRFETKYETKGYLSIEKDAGGFSITYETFDEVKEKSFADCYFNEWLEEPVAYGAFENGKLLGFVEGSIEKWNNRFRISNINIFDDCHRKRGIGTRLMNTILEAAKETGARMIILETQTCNEKAIKFYRKHGFDIIGFDLYAYSNTDIERHEIRIEMGKMIKE